MTLSPSSALNPTIVSLIDTSLPSGKLGSNSAIVIDTSLPSAPSSVGFPSNLSPAAVAVSWSAGTDLHFDRYNAMLCTSTDCVSGCTAAINSLNSPANVTGVDGTTYNACVRSVDKAGNVSPYVASITTTTVDITAPTITSVNSSSLDGFYKEGAVISLNILFSEPVYLTGSVKLKLETGASDREAIYVSGSGTTNLTFNYTVTAGDVSADLEAEAAAQLSLTPMSTLKDAAGNAANPNLPLLGGAQSLSGQKAIVIDTTAPTLPMAVAFPGAYSNSTQITVSWSDATDTNFLQHNVKLCDSSSCSTNCGATSLAIASPLNVSGINGFSYYACVQAIDKAANATAWVATSSATTVDSIVPTITNISSSKANGSYKAGAVIPLRVTFSEPVVVSGTAATLEVETGASDRLVSYNSGSGSSILIFEYTVQNGDTNLDLELTSTSALLLNGDTIRDVAGNAAVLTLPALGLGQSLSGQKSLQIDTTAPTAPSLASFTSGTASTSTSLEFNWTLGTDLYLSQHNVKLCEQNNCSSDCLPSVIAYASPITLTGVNAKTYFGCAQAQDAAGNLSAWIPSAASISVDTSIPVITDVDTTEVSGYYSSGSINVNVSFSENVVVVNGGDLLLTMDTGSVDRNAIYSSGSGTSVLTFVYTLSSGDTSTDLDLQSVNALSLGATASIKDTAGNNANLTLPIAGDTNSISGHKNIVIDTTSPSSPSALSFGTSNSNSAVLSLAFTAGTDTNLLNHRAKLCNNTDCATSCGSITTTSSSPVSLTGTNGQVFYGCLQAADRAGNLSPWIRSSFVNIDTTAPTVTAVTSSLANGAFKLAASVLVSVQFSESVYLTSPANIKLLLETGTTDRQASYVSGSGSNTIVFEYLVQAGDSTAALEVQNSNALTLTGGALIQDPSLNNAILSLPLPGSGNSLSDLKTLLIDGVLPMPATLVNFLSPTSGTTSNDVRWTVGTDANFFTHNVKMCTDVACSVACTGTSTSATSPLAITGITGSTYYGCVQTRDIAGNVSAWASSSGTLFIDQLNPSIVNVNSSTLSGSYNVGTAINIQVKFSKVVDVTGSSLYLLLETGSVDRQAAYVSGSGSDTLLFSFSVASGDATDDLDVNSDAALILAGSTIKDAALNNATLTLPMGSSAEGLAGQKTIIIDTTAPTSPASVGFSVATTNSSSVNVSWSNSFDLHLKQHNIKLCTANDCSTGCGTVSQPLSSPALVPAAAGSSYYACVQGEDDIGNLSSYVASLSSIIVDQTQPTVVDVKSSKADGFYKSGEVIPILVQFSEDVYVSNGNDLKFTLETGATDRDAVYLSGHGTDTLSFNYTVQPGDISADLDAASINALALGSMGSISDASANAALLTLPTLGSAAAHSIAGQSDIVIDTTNPLAPTGPSFAGTSSTSTSLSLNWTDGSDTNFLTHNAKLCAASNCATSCLASSTSTSSPKSLSGANGSTYYGCVRSQDKAGNYSAWVPSADSIVVDTVAPTVLNVSSTKADGIYKVGETIAIRISFSENVLLTNESSITLLLETGTTDRAAIYTSGSASNVLTFTYTVEAGDNSSDLEAASTSALSLGGSGTIKDAAGNDAIRTIPISGGTSLSGQKAIVIDSLNPTSPSAVNFSSSLSNSTSLTLSWTNGTDANFSTHNAKLCPTNDCSSSCLTSTAALSSPASLTGSSGSTYYGCVNAVDNVGNSSPWIASGASITIDTTAPTILSVSSSTAAAAYRAGNGAASDISISVLFSENVDVTNPVALGLLLETGTTDRTATYVSGSGTNTLLFKYTIQSGDTSQDLDYASNGALTLGGSGVIQDAALNNANLLLANPGLPGSLAANAAIIIDTTLPSNPSGLSFPSALTNAATVTGNWTASTDTNMKDYSLKLCTDTGCSAACVGSQTIAHPLVTASFTGTVSGSSYYLCAAANDTSGNTTAYARSVGTVTLDRTSPTISNVSNALSDNHYKAGTVIDITVLLTEAVTVTNGSSISLALNSGRNAIYQSGSGTNSLVFRYTVQAGDNVADLDYVATNSLTLGGSGLLNDAANNAALLTLPTVGGASSLGGQKNITIDTTAPVAPTSVTVPGAYSTSTNVNVSWGVSTDTNPIPLYHVKLCTNMNCSTGCETEGTAASSPLVVTGVNASRYYSCVAGEDKAGNLSLFTASTSKVAIDTTPPAAGAVTTTTTNGAYKVGQVIDIAIAFSENVTVTDNASLGLTLETGAIDHLARYQSGSGSNSLVFRYNVQAGDTSQDLDYLATTPLSAGGGSIKDVAGNDAVLTLATVGASGSLGFSKNILIDTTAPSNPGAISFPSAFSNSTTVNPGWGASSDTNFANYEVQLCLDAAYTGCLASTLVNSAATVTVARTGVNGSSYFAYVRAVDTAGNQTPWTISAASVKIDTTAPAVSNVSSAKADGIYTTGATVAIVVTFSENVTFSNTTGLVLNLATGSSNPAVYTSGNGTNAITFTYTIAGGDNSQDLELASASAISIPGGSTVRDEASNNAVLTVPITGATSLSGQKALIVDTTLPTVASAISGPGSYAPTNVVINFTKGTDLNFNLSEVNLCTSTSCTTGCMSMVTTTGSSATVTGTAATSYYACVRSKDNANQYSAWARSSSSIAVLSQPSFAGISTAAIEDSFNDGTGKVKVTLAGTPGTNIAQYKLFWSSSNTVASFDFNSPISTINFGDAVYDSTSSDTTLYFPVPPGKLIDGYFMVRYVATGDTYADPNTAVSPLTYVLQNLPGYVLVPRAYSGLSYDYYIMRYEASPSSTGTNAGGDTVTTSDSNKQICEAKFHETGVANPSECGNRVITIAAESKVSGGWIGINHAVAYHTCHNASTGGTMVRLPTREEWSRAAEWNDSYSSMITTYTTSSNGNCANGNLAGGSGTRANCKNGLGIYDMAAGAIEIVDERYFSRSISALGFSRFGYGPTLGQVSPNGIDNRTRTITNNINGRAIAMGASADQPSIPSFGTNQSDVSGTGISNNRVGYRCIGFRPGAVPTMAQLALPNEPVYTAADYSGAASTWTIPESNFAGDQRVETVTINLTGDTNDSLAEGNIALKWSPWSKTVSNVTGTGTSSDSGLIYKVYRFSEANLIDLRPTIPWALSGAGSAYSTDKPLSPLAVNSSGQRIYDATTNDGKLIASISNCNSSTPANCTFTDSSSAGTGFSTRMIYNYIVTVADSSGSEVMPLVNRARPKVLADNYAIQRAEPRFRRAAVFLVDEMHQQAQTVPQILSYVPMNLSGLDHDFFIQKYEGTIASGIIVTSDTASTWPIQADPDTGVYSNKAGWCNTLFAKTQTFSSVYCGDGTNINTTTAVIKSARGSTPSGNFDAGSTWKACRNTGIADANGANYYFNQLTDSEFFKAADWGSLDQDDTVDANPYITAGTSIRALEYGAADTSTVRCHTDNSPASPYATNSSQTANCRSRYGVADLIGNMWELTTGKAVLGKGLDNGLDGRGTGSTYPNASFGPIVKFDFLTAFPSAGWTPVDTAGDEYVTSDADLSTTSLRTIFRGGSFGTLQKSGRFMLNILPPNTRDGTTAARCGL